VDISTIIALVGGFVCIFGSYALGGGGSMMALVDFPSMMMTIGGSTFALLLNYSFKEIIDLFKVLGKCFRIPDFGAMKIVEALLSFSEKARREGILSLEEDVESVENSFMKRGLRMVVDSVDPEVIRNILETELTQMNERHGKWMKMLDQWAKLAPGFGMLGTVSGLIGMLKNLEDKSRIGPNMAVALVTTYYGAIMANFIFTPMMGKLGTQDGLETKVREMIIEGVLSIQQGDNPHILQMKLSSFLSPAQQRQLAELHPSA